MNMNPTLLIPIGLYLICGSLFLFGGLINWQLNRSSLLQRQNENIVPFMLGAAAFSGLLICILGAPLFNFSGSTIRLLFSGLWLNAICTAFWYFRAIQSYLNIPQDRYPFLVIALKASIWVHLANLVVHSVSGNAFIFDNHGADNANLVLRSLGNPFSPNLVTFLSFLSLGILGLTITVTLIRHAAQGERPDKWLMFGISLNLIFVIIEATTFSVQWEYAFSLVPLANLVEMLRLTFVRALEAGRRHQILLLESRRQTVQLRSYVSQLSHDFKTPLASLKMGINSTLSHDAPLKSQLAREVDYLDTVSTHMISVLELEQGLVDLRVSPCDATRLLSDVEQTCRRHAERRGIDFNIAVDDDTVISCDAGLTERALCILVEAMLEHAKAHLSLTAYSNAEGTVVEIKHDGPGIGTDPLPSLSARAYRDDIAKGFDNYRIGLAVAIAHGFLVIQKARFILSQDSEAESIKVQFK